LIYQPQYSERNKGSTLVKKQNFQHRANRVNRDYKTKERFPHTTRSVGSVFSVLNFFGCGSGLLRALAGQARPRWEYIK
jgi:hypothetical protein